MTLPVPGSLTYSYNANGVTTVFSYPVRFRDGSELMVFVEDTSGAQTQLGYNVDYTVSGAGNPSGGSVTTLFVPVSGRIVIHRSTAAKQIVDLKDSARNPAEAVEQQLDAMVMTDQDLSEKLKRALVVQPGVPTLLPIPRPSANKPLVWRADGLGLENGAETYDGLRGRVTSNTQAIANEADTRQSNDAALGGLIDQESSARQEADAALDIRVDKEITARTAADAAEATARKEGDRAVASLIGQAGPIEVPVYDTLTAASLAVIKSTIGSIRTGGYSAAGDGGAALYKKVGTEPIDVSSFQSADGAWWQLVGPDGVLPPPQRQVFITSDHQIKNTADQLDRLNIVWNDIAKLRADAVYMLGDVVDVGTNGSATQFEFDDYLGVIYSKNINPEKIFFIPGNHDSGTTLGAVHIEEGNRNLLNYLSAFKRPPFYFTLTGNVCDIFLGYTVAESLAQQVQPIVLNWLAAVLRKYSRSHNVVLHTHCAFYDTVGVTVGAGGTASTVDGFYLRPRAEMVAILDKYPVDAIFSGHNATDLIAADEVLAKTYALMDVDGGARQIPCFLSGPHIEQSEVWGIPGYSLAGLMLTFENGETSVSVKMRNHRDHSWVAAKARSFDLRFPARLSEITIDMGQAVSPEIPIFTDTIRQFIGLSDGLPGRELDPPVTGFNTVKRRLATDLVRVDVAAGVRVTGTEFLHKLTLPGTTIADGGSGDGYSTKGNEIGGNVMFGAKRLSTTGTDQSSGFAVYATNSAGAEVPVIDPQSGGQQLMKGEHYLTSEKYPFFDVRKTVSAPVANGTISNWTSTTYDDYSQFDLATGLFTVAIRGVYDVSATFNLYEGSGLSDEITVSLIRKRAGVDVASLAMAINCAHMANTAARDVISLRGMIGTLAGDQYRWEFASVDPASVVKLQRIYMTASLVRG